MRGKKQNGEMGWGMGLEYVIFTKNPFYSGGGGEVQLVKFIFTKNPNLQKVEGGG